MLLFNILCCLALEGIAFESKSPTVLKQILPFVKIFFVLANQN
jgi:hypothetical protein